MRGVRKVISAVRGSKGGKDGAGKKGDSGNSAIENISCGRSGVPESVAGYSIEANSPVTVRWVNGENGRVIECGRMGTGWQVELHKEGQIFVVSEHGSFEDALGVAEGVMSGGSLSDSHTGTERHEDKDEDTDQETEAPSGFEREVKEVLDGIDKESMESVEEVGEVFGD